MQQVSRGMVGVLEKLGWHPVEIYTLVYTVYIYIHRYIFMLHEHFSVCLPNPVPRMVVNLSAWNPWICRNMPRGLQLQRPFVTTCALSKWPRMMKPL